MAIVNAHVEPSLPFLRMNQHHIVAFRVTDEYTRSAYNSNFPKMLADDFRDGRFKDGTYIIDVNCLKFPVIDVVSLGPSRDFWDLIFRRRKVRVKYIYGSPIQLSFDQARREVVDLIVGRRWHREVQDRESDNQFRERMALCENMHDLIIGKPNTNPQTRKRYQWIGGISFYGEWVG